MDVSAQLRFWGGDGQTESQATMLLGAAEIARLHSCIEEIQMACVDGRVCDDVAWFDKITTLYDYCDLALHPPNVPRAVSSTEGKS